MLDALLSGSHSIQESGVSAAQAYGVFIDAVP